MGWRLHTYDCECIDPWGVAKPCWHADVPWAKDVYGGPGDGSSEVVRAVEVDGTEKLWTPKKEEIDGT